MNSQQIKNGGTLNQFTSKPQASMLQDIALKPKRTKAGQIHHKPGCGVVGHAGECPVTPQDNIGGR